MFLAILFWVLMVIWIAFDFYRSDRTFAGVGGNLFLWILLAILGFKVFGFPG